MEKIVENKKRIDKGAFNDFTKIIRQNDIIDKLLKRVCQLEINEQLDSEEATTLLSIAKKYATINSRLFRKYPVSDNNFKEFLKLIEEMNQGFDVDDFFEYFNDDRDLKLKRFVAESSVLSLQNNKITMEELLGGEDKWVVISGKNYTYEEAVKLLENSGYEEIIEQIDAKVDELMSDYEAQKRDDNYLDYNRLCLIQNTMMKYLLDEIESSNNKNIKNELIKYKYNIIIICSELTNKFANNPHDFVEIESYQNNLLTKYLEDPQGYDYTFEDWDLGYKVVINQELRKIKERNIDETTQFDDVLAKIYIKTYSSLISNPKTVKEIIDNANIAIDNTDSVINKAVIKAASEIDNNISFSKKMLKKVK